MSESTCLDFELAFTVQKNKIHKFKNLDVSIVGEILPKNEGIFLLDKNKKYRLKHGYDHFL